MDESSAVVTTQTPASITKSEEHNLCQTIRQEALTPAANKPKANTPLKIIHHSSLVTKVKMARKEKMEVKNLQESMVGVKSGRIAINVKSGRIARGGNDKRLCFCRQVDSVKMILCRNSTCAYGWCHYSCVQVQRKPRRSPWFCPKCKGANVEARSIPEGSETESKQGQEKRMKETKRSEKGMLRSLQENVQSKMVERSKTANKEGSCGMVHLTEKEKWEATKAEWIKMAKLTKNDEGSGLTQRKSTILRSLVPDLSTQ